MKNRKTRAFCVCDPIGVCVVVVNCLTSFFPPSFQFLQWPSMFENVTIHPFDQSIQHFRPDALFWTEIFVYRTSFIIYDSASRFFSLFKQTNLSTISFHSIINRQSSPTEIRKFLFVTKKNWFILLNSGLFDLKRNKYSISSIIANPYSLK